MRKVLSILLCIVMVLSVLNCFIFSASANEKKLAPTAIEYTYDRDAAIEFAKNHCASDGNTCKNGWLCAEFVANC